MWRNSKIKARLIKLQTYVFKICNSSMTVATFKVTVSINDFLEQTTTTTEELRKKNWWFNE